MKIQRDPVVFVDRYLDPAGEIFLFEQGDDPVLCEVIVDPGQNFEPKLSSKVLPDGKIVSPPIDDMFPFLSRDEFEGIKASIPGKKV